MLPFIPVHFPVYQLLTPSMELLQTSLPQAQHGHLVAFYISF